MALASESIAYRLHCPSVEISVSGVSYPVLFTHSALLTIRSLTGIDPLTGKFPIISPPAKVLRATVYAVLRDVAGPHMQSERQAGDLLRLAKVVEVHDVLIRSWDASMPEPEPDLPDPDRHLRLPSGRPAPPPPPLTWLEAWAIARYDFGLTDAEWLSSTPRMLQALRRRRLEDMRWQELQMGTVAAITANFSMCRPKRPFRAHELMFHPYPDVGKYEREEEATGEALLAMFQSMGCDVQGDVGDVQVVH